MAAHRCAADGVAEQDRLIEVERSDQPEKQRGVALCACRPGILTGGAVSRPIHRDHPKSIPESLLERSEIAAPVADRMQADDRRLRARRVAVVDRDRYPIDHDGPTMLRDRKREPAGWCGFQLDSRQRPRGCASDQTGAGEQRNDGTTHARLVPDRESAVHQPR